MWVRESDISVEEARVDSSYFPAWAPSLGPGVGNAQSIHWSISISSLDRSNNDGGPIVRCTGCTVSVVAEIDDDPVGGMAWILCYSLLRWNSGDVRDVRCSSFTVSVLLEIYGNVLGVLPESTGTFSLDGIAAIILSFDTGPAISLPL